MSSVTESKSGKKKYAFLDNASPTSAYFYRDSDGCHFFDNDGVSLDDPEPFQGIAWDISANKMKGSFLVTTIEDGERTWSYLHARNIDTARFEAQRSMDKIERGKEGKFPGLADKVQDSIDDILLRYIVFIRHGPDALIIQTMREIGHALHATEAVRENAENRKMMSDNLIAKVDQLHEQMQDIYPTNGVYQTMEDLHAILMKNVKQFIAYNDRLMNPVIGDDGTKYVVADERILGYIQNDNDPWGIIGVLAGPEDPLNGPVSAFGKTLRSATEYDFERFRVTLPVTVLDDCNDATATQDNGLRPE